MRMVLGVEIQERGSRRAYSQQGANEEEDSILAPKGTSGLQPDGPIESGQYLSYPGMDPTVGGGRRQMWQSPPHRPF